MESKGIAKQSSPYFSQFPPALVSTVWILYAFHVREHLRRQLVLCSMNAGLIVSLDYERAAYSMRAIARMKGTKRKTISYIKRLGIEAGLLEAVRHKRQVMLRLTMRAITACEEVTTSIERVS